MSLTEKINEELKQAMKSKDEAALRGLRAIKAALLLAKTDKGGSAEIGEDQEIKLLQKLAKQRKESIDIYKQQNRPELAETEEQELAIIERFLPQQMSEEEIRQTIAQVIKESGATSAAETGKVMPLAIKALGGRADNKTVSALVREMLS